MAIVALGEVLVVALAAGGVVEGAPLGAVTEAEAEEGEASPEKAVATSEDDK